MALATEWTKDCSTLEEKQAREDLIRNSIKILEVVKKIVLGHRTEINAKEIQVENFDNPSWSHKQAFFLGRKSEIKKLEDLLSFIT